MTTDAGPEGPSLAADPAEPLQSAGRHYAELVDQQLTVERDRKSSIERRGLSVMTSAGVLVTLLTALGAFAVGSEAEPLPEPAKWILALASVLFLAAAAAAISTSTIRTYREADVDSLQRLLDKRFWTGREWIGEQRVAGLRLEILEAARFQNDRKATALEWAMHLEAVAAMLVVVALIVVVSTG